MNLKHITLSALLTITLISGLCLAQDSEVTLEDAFEVASEDETVVASAEVETALDGDGGMVDEGGEISEPNLQGIWILPVKETQISMVVYQDGNDLFGAATSQDPEPWNAVMTGSVSDDQIVLNTLSIQNGVLVVMKVAGTAASGTLTGTFVRTDSNGKVDFGDVMGFQTSPDTSGYEPAEVEVAVAAPAVAHTAAPTTAALDPAASADQTTTTGSQTQPTQEKKSGPVDVTTLASTVGPAGLIPPGMGM